MGRLLQGRNYRLLCIGQGASLLGEQINVVALSWLALQMTGNALALGTVLAVAGLPPAVLILLSGLVTDRFSPRAVLLVADGLRLVLVCCLLALILAAHVTLGSLYAVGLGFGILSALATPAGGSIVPTLVPRAVLQPANSLYVGLAQLAAFAGPACAGVVIAEGLAAVPGGRLAGNVVPAFALYGIGLVVSVVTLCLMRLPGQGRWPDGRHGTTQVLGAIAGGWRYAWQDPLLRLLLPAILAANLLLAGPLAVGIPVLARLKLPEGTSAYGFMAAGWGGGNLLGALAAGAVRQSRGLGLLFCMLFVLFGAGLAALGWVSLTWLGFVVLFVMGAGNGYLGVILRTLIHRRTPEQLLGRVMSVFFFARTLLVPRPHLLERLNRGLAQGCRLTLISAPAGYGKTTLACDWLAQPAGSESSPPAVITWLALDEGDNDPARFIAYLVAALRKFDPGIGQVTLELLSLPHVPAAPALMTPLINDVALVAAPGGAPAVLVLDDLHSVRAGLIFDALDFLVQHTPSNLHVVLLTREDPPLSLATLRAHGQMTELRTQDLRFTDEEAQAFFKATMGLDLEPAIASGLEARTEGWVAGLQLAALSVQGCPAEDLGEFLAAFAGSDRYVMDYLIEQVACRLPPEIHSFMHATSVLDRMNASLCDAVAGRTDGRAMLQRLDQANLFLVRLDAQGQWFRFHHLFADLLRLELDSQDQIELHRRAAKWFEENDLLPEAVDHALAGEDYTGAARLMRLATGALLRTSEFRTLLSWIDRLPREVLAADAELCVHAAAASIFTADAVGAAAWLDRLEPTWHGPAADHAAAAPEAPGAASGYRIRGRLLAIRAWLASFRGDMGATRECADQALALMGKASDAGTPPLPAADPAATELAGAFYRMVALLALGHAQSAAGETLAEEQTYREVVALGRQAGHVLATAVGLLSLAFNLLQQGRRREAQELCERGLHKHVDRRGAPLPVARILYLPLSTALYQANCLEEARESAIKGLEASRQLLSEDIMGGDGELALALCQYALGEKEAAIATVRETRAAAEQLGYQHVVRGFAAIEADLHLRDGNMGPARQWFESRRAALAEPPVAEREVEYRTCIRFLVAEGRFAEAQALLHLLERQARGGGRHARTALILIWRTVVEQGLHNADGAAAYLAEAVRIAAPEGFRRSFLDTGQPAIRDLLPKVRGLAPEFVDSILNAWPQRDGASHRVEQPVGPADHTAPAQGAEVLVEPLSARELEVLALLAEGLSYRQVAEKLIVAMGTVQAHCGNIYGKLGVNNRTQALAKARELHLL